MLAEILNFQGAKPCLGVGSFSNLFDIKKTQYELDFVDIDPEADMPLFLDPYYISKCEFPFAVRFPEFHSPAQNVVQKYKRRKKKMKKIEKTA